MPDRNMIWAGKWAEAPVYSQHVARIDRSTSLTARRKSATAGGAGEPLLGLRLSKESNMPPKSLPKSAVGRSMVRSDLWGTAVLA